MKAVAGTAEPAQPQRRRASQSDCGCGIGTNTSVIFPCQGQLGAWRQISVSFFVFPCLETEVKRGLSVRTTKSNAFSFCVAVADRSHPNQHWRCHPLPGTWSASCEELVSVIKSWFPTCCLSSHLSIGSNRRTGTACARFSSYFSACR